MTNLKLPKGGFQKSISTTQHVWSFSEIVPWTGEFHPKSQITILVAHQLELFQKKFQTGGRVEAGFPTGVESMGAVPLLSHWGGGSSKFDERGLEKGREHGGSMGGLKTLLKNTCEEVHLLLKLPATSQQDYKFTKNELLHTYFSRF